MEVSDQLQEILQIRNEVRRLNLAGADIVLIQPINLLAKIYNGTGPEFMPDKIRKLLDSIARVFLPGVMVHDIRFEFSDGSQASFHQANVELLVNCITCALDAYKWYQIRRYSSLLKAVTIYRACQKFGWIAWRSAYLKNQTKETK